MNGPAPAWAFHVARAARERFGIDEVPAGARGDVLATDLPAIRRLAARVATGLPPGAPPVLPGQVAALAVLHELGHLLIERFDSAAGPRGTGRGVSLDGALGALRLALGGEADALLERFGREFPGGSGATVTAPEPPRDLLAELLLTRVANENPATGPLRPLIDDAPLATLAAWPLAIGVLERAFGGPADEASEDPERGHLLAVLRAPAAHAPTSLTGQLRYARQRWVPVLGLAAARLLEDLDTAIGELAEEEAAAHRGFGRAGDGAARPGGGPGGFGRSEGGPAFGTLLSEAEAFSRDADWMPGLVLQARSTFVWLEQLSRRYGRAITTLDAIPDEELEKLARWGISGLWLIGVWQRSPASAEIKHRRGNPDAIASAYSLDDYRIADELGGEPALERLRERARAHGLRLACDMVPNHMGLDSRWVVEHPEWLLSVPETPYPAYSFTGPDLSRDGRVEIRLEDHYWDGSDAAVVFQRRERATGETRFVYHGNDGTSLPWNDTAQLDFLRADVREQVIRTILDVARRFPVIRFDAAMVLARQHVRRLWWPEPGAAGGVPSRAAHAISRADFDRLMPHEFWREVVDRVAAEVPDTLLLAEAFWLMEGYFVRTLGMHRVYNSAFMHMLRDEDIAGYRRVIRETIEFDPEILERYVNFMSNPDEATAVEQFGKDGKYLGVATVLATLPGLPMLGHGQVEGFAEKYGMEFRRPNWDERPDEALVARHERDLAPLFRSRGRFSRAGDFRLYDLVADDGSVDERVLAYSNGRGDGRSLVAYLGAWGEAAGRLRESAAFAVKGADGSKTLTRQLLADALELPAGPGWLVTWRDWRGGLEYLAPADEVRERGLPLHLGAYGCLVLEGFRAIRAEDGRWAELAARLGGAGVPSLADAHADLALAPLHDRLRALVSDGHVAMLAEALAGPAAAAESAPAGRSRPSAAEPSAAEPSAAEPSAAEPSAAEPSAAQPSAAQPSAAQPSAAQPSAAEPSAAEPSAAEPSAAQPSSAGRTEPAEPEPPVAPRAPRHDPAASEAAVRAAAAFDLELRAATPDVPEPRSAADPRSVRDRLAGAPVAAARVAATAAPLLADPAVRRDVALALVLGGASLDPGRARAAGARFDAARLARPLGEALAASELDPAAAREAVARVRALIALPAALEAAPESPGPAAVVARSLLADVTARDAAGAHPWDGVEWLVAESWSALVARAVALIALARPDPATIRALATVQADLDAAAADAGFRLDAVERAVRTP